jgi:hypothetical protein
MSSAESSLALDCLQVLGLVNEDIVIRLGVGSEP